MGQAQTMEALRAIAARSNGYHCHYCRVPTAATIEHVQARVTGGQSWADNVVLACPYCNQRKGAKPVEEFIESGEWQIQSPTDLEETTKAMLAQRFGWDRSSGLVSTNSVHAKLELKSGDISLLVRPGKNHEWVTFHLGRQDHSRVVAASYDFLFRHFTPKQPKRRPPKRAFVKRSQRS